MAYKALLNGTLFFDTDTDLDSLALTSALVKLKAGSAGDFTFVIPPQNDAYGKFHRLVDFVDVYDDDTLIFSGRVYSVKISFDTQYEISCEGMMAVLSDTIFRPTTFTGSLRDLVENIIAGHNSQVSTDKQITLGQFTITNYHVEEKEFKNYDSNIARLKELVETYGGFLQTRKVSGITYLDWLEESTEYSDQKIVLSENLLELSKTQDSSNIITVLIPTGALLDDGDKLTISSVNGGLDYITAPQEVIDEFGLIYGTQEWGDISDASELLARAKRWLDINCQPQFSVKIKAVDLKDAGIDVSCFMINQFVQVISDPHGLTDTMMAESSTVDLGVVDVGIVDVGGTAFWLEVNELNLNLLDKSQSTLQVGQNVSGYVSLESRSASAIVSKMEALSQAYSTKAFLDNKILQATELITGNIGGYVVMHDSDDDGYPDEILVMDNPDINTASNVWRFNKNGLGFSSSGYDGIYGLALTMDGMIVTDYAKIANWNINYDPLGHISIYSDSYDTELTGCKARTLMSASPEEVVIGEVTYPAAAFAVDAQTLNAVGDPTTDYYRIFWVDINGNTHTDTSYANTFQQTSDRRLKEDIKPLTEPATLKLKPVTYRMKSDPFHKQHHGFIAQDIQKIADEDWGIVQGKDQLSLGYTELIADMVATIQSLNKRIEALEKEK